MASLGMKSLSLHSGYELIGVSHVYLLCVCVKYSQVPNASNEHTFGKQYPRHHPMPGLALLGNGDIIISIRTVII